MSEKKIVVNRCYGGFGVSLKEEEPMSEWISTAEKLPDAAISNQRGLYE